MKKVILIFTLLSLLIPTHIISQNFLPIWEKRHMPNSKGIILKDSIANERIYQVGTPGLYIFQPSITENKNAAVIIIPGGGYARLAYEISGFQIAKWFNTIGITAFVLSHRLPQSPDVIESYKAPIQDAQRAIQFIRFHAINWNIDGDKIGVIGFSAGGHLAACLSTFNDDWSNIGDSLDIKSHMPNFTMLISPAITMKEESVHKGSRQNLLGKEPVNELLDKFSCELQVNSNTPPTLLIHAFNDKTVPANNSLLYYGALLKNNIKKSSLHIFPEGGHNIALRNNPGTTNLWTALAEKWLLEIGIIK